MHLFIKENINRILLLILISLLLILWGRFISREINASSGCRELVTTADRIKCLKLFGWEADPGSETYEKIKIPEEFDAVYNEYNKLQLLSGFDLRDYKGKTAVRYTYLAENFPYKTDTAAYINVYIYDGKIIAGDCMTPALAGEMLPLDRRFLS